MKTVNQSWNKRFTASDNKTTGVIKFCSIAAPYWTGHDQYGWMDIIILHSFQFLVSPLLGFVFAVRHSMVLARYNDFSVLLQTFRFVARLLVVWFLVACVFLLSNVLNLAFLYDLTNLYARILPNLNLWSFLTMYVSISCAAGVGYLFYVRINRRFIWLATCFVLVVPALTMFLCVLVLKAFPSLRKHAPQDGVGKGAL